MRPREMHLPCWPPGGPRGIVDGSDLSQPRAVCAPRGGVRSIRSLEASASRSSAQSFARVIIVALQRKTHGRELLVLANEVDRHADNPQSECRTAESSRQQRGLSIEDDLTP